MLSLRRPRLLVFNCVDFIEAIQESLVQSQRTRHSDGHTCVLLFIAHVQHLGNLVVVKRNIILSVEARI